MTLFPVRPGIPVAVRVPSELSHAHRPVRVAFSGRCQATRRLSEALASALQATWIDDTSAMEEELSARGYKIVGDIPDSNLVRFQIGMMMRHADMAARYPDATIVFDQSPVDRMAFCLRHYARSHSGEIAAVYDAAKRGMQTIDLVFHVVDAPGSWAPAYPSFWYDLSLDFIVRGLLSSVVSDLTQVVHVAHDAPVQTLVDSFTEVWREKYADDLKSAETASHAPSPHSGVSGREGLERNT